jgi:hypothetical protein
LSLFGNNDEWSDLTCGIVGTFRQVQSDQKISKFFVSYVEASSQDMDVVREVMAFIKDKERSYKRP